MGFYRNFSVELDDESVCVGGYSIVCNVLYVLNSANPVVLINHNASYSKGKYEIVIY